MRRDADGTIVLSKRNLLALLSKVDDPTSRKTLLAGQGGVNGVGDETLIVKCEPDEVHYAQRPPAGRMSDISEAFIADAAQAKAPSWSPAQLWRRYRR
jgi:hypothetical protein